MDRHGRRIKRSESEISLPFLMNIWCPWRLTAGKWGNVFLLPKLNNKTFYLDNPPRAVQTLWSQIAFTERWGSSDQQTTQTDRTNGEADKWNVIFSKHPISTRC
ncbi:hypothetical protein SRHO_G00018490 [Serrasalmus rhombeus]